MSEEVMNRLAEAIDRQTAVFKGMQTKAPAGAGSGGWLHGLGGAFSGPGGYIGRRSGWKMAGRHDSGPNSGVSARPQSRQSTWG